MQFCFGMGHTKEWCWKKNGKFYYYNELLQSLN